MGADSVYGELFRVLAALAVVVPAAYLSTRLLSGRVWARRARYMRLVESLPLGFQRGLHLVQVGERLFLVGGSEKGVTLLAEVDRAAELHPLAAEALGEGATPSAPWREEERPGQVRLLAGLRRGRASWSGGDHGDGRARREL